MEAKLLLRHVEVIVRVRPSTKEKENTYDATHNRERNLENGESKKCCTHQSNSLSTSCTKIDNVSHAIHLCDVGETYFVPHRKTYLPDQVFGPSCTNESLFNELVLPKLKGEVNPVANSIECHQRLPERETEEVHTHYDKAQPHSSNDTLCFLAYGHTNSGKTHSIVGENGGDGSDDGLLTRTVMYMLNECVNARVRVAMLEIYMERVYDLLANGVERRVRRVSELGLHTNGENGNSRKKGYYGNTFTATSLRVVVEELSTITISSLQQWMAVSAFGMHSRRTTTTERNERSSRSHALFIIQSLESNMRVCFVDLAGSERQSSFSTQLNKESIFINKSLSQLSTVLRALSSQRVFANGKRSYVNFRGSTLTVLLERYLRGVSRTTFLACIHPSPTFYKETLNTLRYSHRLKLIRTVKLCNMHVANNKSVNLHSIKKKVEKRLSDINNNSISINVENNGNSDDDDNEYENSCSAEYAKYNDANVQSSIFYEDNTKQKDCDVNMFNSILPTTIELTRTRERKTENYNEEQLENKRKRLTSNEKETLSYENLEKRHEFVASSMRCLRNVESASSTLNSVALNNNVVDVHCFVNRSRSESTHASRTQSEESNVTCFNVNFDDCFDSFVPSSLQVIGYVTNKLINTSTRVFTTNCETVGALNCSDCNNNCSNNKSNTNCNDSNTFDTKQTETDDNTMFKNKMWNWEHATSDDYCAYPNHKNTDRYAREFAILPVQDVFASLALFKSGIKPCVSLYSSVNCSTEPTCVEEWNCEKVETRALSKYNLSMEKSKEQLDVHESNYNNNNSNNNGSKSIIDTKIGVFVGDNNNEEEQMQKICSQRNIDICLNEVQRSKIAPCRYYGHQHNVFNSWSNKLKVEQNKGREEKECCTECVYALALFDCSEDNVDSINIKTCNEISSNKCDHVSLTSFDRINSVLPRYVSKNTIFPFAIVFAVKCNSSTQLKEYVLEWLVHLGSETSRNSATIKIKDVLTAATNSCAVENAAKTNTVTNCISVKAPCLENDRTVMNAVKDNRELNEKINHTSKLKEFAVNTYVSKNCKIGVVPSAECGLEASLSELTLIGKKEAVFNEMEKSKESVFTDKEYQIQANKENETFSSLRDQTENMLDNSPEDVHCNEYRQASTLIMHGGKQEHINDMYKGCEEACTDIILPKVEEGYKPTDLPIESKKIKESQDTWENDNNNNNNISNKYVTSATSNNSEQIAVETVKLISTNDEFKSHNDDNNRIVNKSCEKVVEYSHTKELLEEQEKEQKERTKRTDQIEKQPKESAFLKCERSKDYNNKEQLTSIRTDKDEHMNGSNYNSENGKMEHEERHAVSMHKRRINRRRYVRAAVQTNHEADRKSDDNVEQRHFHLYNRTLNSNEEGEDGDTNKEGITGSAVVSPIDITPMYYSCDKSMKKHKCHKSVKHFNELPLNSLQQNNSNMKSIPKKENYSTNSSVNSGYSTNMEHHEMPLCR